MILPPVAGLGPDSPDASNSGHWLTPDRLVRIRAILLALTLFLGLAVWVFHSVAGMQAPDSQFITRLRGVGIMTWLYALVQLVDMRYYRSRFARRRLANAGIPESLLGWLLAQMLPWFGIVYYGLTTDARWFVAGLTIFLLSLAMFPIRDQH